MLKVEALFSFSKSIEEINSRLSEQENQLNSFKNQNRSFNQICHSKVVELINGIFNKEETISYRRNKVKKWLNVIQSDFPNFYKKCRSEMESIKHLIECKQDILYFKK